MMNFDQFLKNEISDLTPPWVKRRAREGPAEVIGSPFASRRYNLEKKEEATLKNYLDETRYATENLIRLIRHEETQLNELTEKHNQALIRYHQHSQQFLFADLDPDDNYTSQYIQLAYYRRELARADA